MKATPAMSAYFNMLYAGDITGAAAMFAEYPDDPMAASMSAQFESRFVERTSGLDLSSVSSPKAQAVLTLYQDYWRNALMQTAPLSELDAALFSELDEILTANGFAPAGDDEDKMEADLEAFLAKENVFSQAGRTPPLQDLIVWTKNDSSIVRIELTDGVFDVKVNYLDDFVSNGWMNFASFGMTRAGGWGEKEAVFCVCGSYDMTSERYLVSFLKHEARHHIDLALYPELAAPDMEYRGKLTELAFADVELYALLRQFTVGANKIENAPHPLANWYVVDGLSRILLDGKHPADPSAWEAVSKDDIHAAARRLLKEHDDALRAAGAETTKGVITA